MKRTVLAVLCSAALFASAVEHSYAEDSLADKEMADRYTRAAQANDATAQFYLGALHSAGVGRPQSDTEAFRWFSRAAEQGHSQATLVLSGLYVIGRGTPKDNVSAYKWAAIAASDARIDEIRNGARQLMRVLESRMTLDVMRQAEIEAKRWHSATTRGPQDSADDARGDRRQPETLPPVSSQPRQSTVDDPARPDRSTESGTASKPKFEFDDLLNRLPPGLRKRMGL
jgi:hypothetical protein